MTDDTFGQFKVEMTSNTHYRSWSILDMEFKSYKTMKKVIDVISPILAEEEERMDKFYEERERIREEKKSLYD